ncbi:MNIO family bufferin maturase [Legionella sp. WA2022007384]
MLISGDRIGIGLRPPHYAQIVLQKPKIDWLEVHTEHFMSDGGPLLDILSAIGEIYPISFHGVGLSLGSVQGLCKNHLKRIKTLVKRFEPVLLSDHLSWSNTERAYLPDLLPIPYNEESLVMIANHIDEAQNYLQRVLLIENPSSYLEYRTSSYSEGEFLAELVKRTGAQILLDVNNIYVSCFNHGWDPYQYIQSIPYEKVQEIHLAGHSSHMFDEKNSLLLDTHDGPVCEEVWELYRYAVDRIGPVPTLMEWDADLPDLEVLLNEARKSVKYINNKANTE